jgi:hypothetical protein
MKSSPFKLFSLSAREADQRGNYANPELGRYKATTFDHPDLSGIKNSKPKAESVVDPKGKIAAAISKPNGLISLDVPKPNVQNITTNVEKITKFEKKNNGTRVSLKQAYEKADSKGWLVPNKKTGEKESFEDYSIRAKEDPQYNKRSNVGYNELEKTNYTIGNTTLEGDWKSKTSTKNNNSVASNSGANFNGSPVKHNAGAVGSIAGGNPLAGGIAGIGQQISNQAQQRAADAGGSTSVDPFLPPPNQVAETGSYGGNGDRMLEMDSNPVGNQSIGRNANLASQLFGSGQRASMLAMKGTPLHHDSEKQAHTHPTKTTTKMKPDGEYPGARYVKGDLVDQDDLLDKTKLDAHIATQVQSDKKGTFIKEMPDSGPGSDIETSKGFGKKIRLESMGRSSYTSNMKDQLDPHDFLFKNTPKNNKKK